MQNSILFIIFSVLGIGNGLVTNVTNTINIPFNNMNWDRYQRLETIYNFMLEMESLHPNIVQVLSN